MSRFPSFALPAFRGTVVRLSLVAVLASGLAWSGAAAEPASASTAEPNFPASMSGYHNYLEMVAEVQQAAVNYPSLVSVFSIGKSYQGRDILAAKISNDVTVDKSEPEVLIDALHHAREHLATEQALAILRWLTTGYGTDPTVTRLVNTRVVYIIFALNPDGMRYDLTGSPFRGWRKNRQPTAGTTAIGTDLNRNYNYHWGCCAGSSGNPSQLTYRGPYAFSAPETRALRDFVASRVIDGVQRIRTHITLHTNGKLVLWPYAYTRTDVPVDMTALDHAALAKLGRAMAALSGYRAEQSSDLYVSDGDEIDWLYGTYRIFSYTFELYPAETGRVATDFYPDDSHIAAETNRNRAAIMVLIDRAGCPYQDLGASYAQADCGPLYDDLEINRGWVANAAGTDTATGGRWQLAMPMATYAGGQKQPGHPVSGRRVLVTGAAAGADGNANDVDGGTTTIRSRPIALPADPAAFGLLTFRYSFTHDAASTAEDSFQVLVETGDGTQTPVFAVAGEAANRDASWAVGSASLSAWAGQTVRLVMSATDGGADNLVEAAVDDIRIRQP